MSAPMLEPKTSAGALGDIASRMRVVGVIGEHEVSRLGGAAR